jgi:hypothetical protein
MSILRSKHSGWTWEGRRTPFGGSGGGGQQASPAPTQTTSYNTNIPEYARPYVENMLQSTQKQIYNEDMTGFRPYQPYSTDVNNYFAGFSPLQQSAQQAAYYMQTPGQFGVGTGLAGASGLGSLGLAGQAAGAGQQFAQQAQNPMATQAYMSPYMQNVVDYQKSQALRDFNIGRPMRARQAVGAGAFGGSRQAIVEAEAERSLGSQLQGIAATGSQKAFEDAQRQQQFGAQLGLQGIQTGLQGMGQAGQAAGILGQLGQQQFGAEKDIINLQSQMGAQQQALEQAKINQAIQDYAIAQQYPYMQLGMMNAMLRGLPMQTQTTQLYQAQPSTLQQGIGLAGAAGSLFGGKAAGGAIKEYRQGGIVGYAPGGVIDSTRAQLEQIADMPGGVQKLEQIRNSSDSDAVRKMAAEILMEKQMEAQAERQTQQARMSGIAMAGGPAFESMGMAGGGIIAFQEGGLGMMSPEFGGVGSTDADADQERLNQLKLQKDIEQYNFLKDASPVAAKRMLDENPTLKNKVTPAAPAPAAAAPKPEAKPPAAKESTNTAQVKEDKAAAKGGASFAKFLSEIKEAGPKGQIGADYEKFLDERLGKSAERLSRDERMAMAKGFLKFASTPAPGGIMQAAAAGLGEYATGIEGARKAQDTMEAEAQKARVDLDKARRAEERGDVAAAREAYDKYEDRMSRIQAAQISAGAAGQAGRFDKEAVERVMAENPGMKFADALQIVKGAGRFESTEVQRAKAAQEALNKSIPYLRLSQSKKPEDQAKAKQIRDEIFGNFGLLAPGGGIGGGQGGGGNLVPNKDGSFNYVPR